MINKNFNQSNLARGGKVLGPGSGKKLLRPQKRAGSTDRSRRVGQSDNQQPRLIQNIIQSLFSSNTMFVVLFFIAFLMFHDIISITAII